MARSKSEYFCEFYSTPGAHLSYFGGPPITSHARSSRRGGGRGLRVDTRTGCGVTRRTSGTTVPCGTKPIQPTVNLTALRALRLRALAELSGNRTQLASTPRPQKEKGGPGSTLDCGCAGIAAFKVRVPARKLNASTWGNKANSMSGGFGTAGLGRRAMIQ